MSEEFTLEAQSRTVTGKKVKKIRREGQVPAVVYGQKEPINIQLNALKTQLVLRDSGGNAVLNLNIDGESTRTVVARDVQKHVIRGDLIHIDFYEVDENTPVRAEASLYVTGRSVPESQGLGSTTQVLNSVEIEAKPGVLVASLEVKAERMLKPGQVLMVKDIDAPEGVTILTAGRVPVAKFTAKRQKPGEEAAAAS